MSLPSHTEALVSALIRDRSNIVMVVCPDDLGLQREVVDEVRELAELEDYPCAEATSVEEARRLSDHLVLLLPDDEEDTVDELGGLRDAIIAATPPRSCVAAAAEWRCFPSFQVCCRSSAATSST